MDTILKTKRLILTTPSLSDLEELYTLTSKEEVNLFNPKGADKNIKEAKETLIKFIESWEKDNIGIYTVRLLKNNDFLGYIGVYLKKEFNMKIFNLSYRIEPMYQRKGYVVEACDCILKEVKKEYQGIPIMALTKNNNLPSINLAKKLGFIYNEAFDDYHEKDDVYLFNVPKEMSSTYLKKS